MPKTRREINAPSVLRRFCGKNQSLLLLRHLWPYIRGMNYILAILLPPLSILLTGRPILAIIVFLIWIPALVFSGGLTHPMFILLAWLLIFQSREGRRSL